MRRFALIALCWACASSVTPYTLERTRAERAYREGDFERAAEHWRVAGERAENAHDRSEAEYRRAATYERAGRVETAERLYASIERGNGERAERAAFARAGLTLERGELERGQALLRAALLRFPNSGLARRAVRAILEHVEKREGAPAAIAEAAVLERALRGSEVEEDLVFERAVRLERASEPRAALDVYLDLARRFPYPGGAYWDDALLGAARLELGFGRPERAISHLERLLGERENARISGSYERKSFAEARFRIAEIARDVLGDPSRAKREFRRVWSEHPTSRLGDDALFEEALLSVSAGQREEACASARLFSASQGDSRYARCTQEICPGLPSSSERACPGYALERIRRAAQQPPPTQRPSSSSSSSSSSSR